MINYFLGKRCSPVICCDPYEGASFLLEKNEWCTTCTGSEQSILYSMLVSMDVIVYGSVQ